MRPIIVDIGSYALKLGYGGEYAPRLDIPLVVGKVREDIDFMTRKRIFDALGVKKFKQEFFLGHEALYLRNYLDLNWLYDGKRILDEFFFDKIFESTVELLKKPIKNQPILITQPFHSNIMNEFGPKLFSSYYVSELIPTFQPLLNLIASSLKTGLVIDIGHFLTQVTPVINGVIIVDGVRVEDLGGKDITQVLQQIMTEKRTFEGLTESSILSTMAIAETVKEVHGYVSRNPSEEMDDPQGSIAKFPLLFGEDIEVGVERFLGPETLFAPRSGDISSIDELISEVIMNYDAPVQQALLGNILLTGGTSLLPGLAERLHDELVRKFIDFDYEINIIPFAKFGSPRYSTFFGAAKLAATELDKSIKISKVDYEYSGELKLAVTFLEEFPTIFDRAAPIELDKIIISVKNFFNKKTYQELYNILNQQRRTQLKDLANQLHRSPLELYQMIETLISYEIVQGEMEAFDFVNSQIDEKDEARPVATRTQTTARPITPEPVAEKRSVKAEPYVPSFQQLDDKMPDVQDIKRPKTMKRTRPKAQYTYQEVDQLQPDVVDKKQVSTSQRGRDQYKSTFQKVDAVQPDVVEARRRRSPKRSAGKQDDQYTFQKVDAVQPDVVETHRRRSLTGTTGEQDDQYTFKKVDAVQPDVVEAQPRRSATAQEGEEQDQYTFQKIDAMQPSVMDGKGSKVAYGTASEAEDQDSTQYEYSFQQVDDKMKEEWEKDPTILSGKKRIGRKTQVLQEDGATFERVDPMKSGEWEKEGLISTPKEVVPKGFFDQVAIPEDEVKHSTFEKVDQVMAKEWAKDKTILTGKKTAARDKLKLLVDTGPSFAKADKMMAAEWEKTGVVSTPKLITPKGFFQESKPKPQEDVDLPTFLKIKDEEVPQPKKIEIGDLLKPKSKKTGPIKSKKDKLPTYLQGGQLSEEQLRQIKEFEEEERRRKKKDEKERLL